MGPLGLTSRHGKGAAGTIPAAPLWGSLIVRMAILPYRAAAMLSVQSFCFAALAFSLSSGTGGAKGETVAQPSIWAKNTALGITSKPLPKSMELPARKVTLVAAATDPVETMVPAW